MPNYIGQNEAVLIPHPAPQQFSPVITSVSTNEYLLLWTLTNNGLFDLQADQFEAPATRHYRDLLLDDVNLGGSFDVSGNVVSWIADGAVLTDRYSGPGLDRPVQANSTPLNGIGIGTVGTSVTMLLGSSHGGYVVTWNARAPESPEFSDYTHIYSRQYDLFGNAIGNQVQVSTSVNSGYSDVPDVAALSDGGYVVSWTSANGSGVNGAGTGISTQRYNANGVAVGAEVQIVVPLSSTSRDLGAVAGLETGGYVVTWASLGQDGSGWGIYAQLFDATGAKVGGETRVNSFTNFDQTSPVVTGLDDGGYVISWVSAGQDGSGTGIYAQRYTHAGVAVGGEVRVHENVSGDQGTPSVTTLTDGSFVISWTQDYGGPIHSRLFTPEAAMQSDGGNNELTGTSTIDALNGGAGNDTIIGLSGQDVLTGSTGADIIFGGEGDDRISADREIGFDGNVDVDQIYAGNGNDVIFAGYGDIVDGGAGFDVLNLSYVGASQGITGDTKVLFAGQPLTPGGGTVRNIERFDAVALTNFNDVMVIGDQADPATAYGYDGDDHLIGQENRVVLHGGNGNDLLVGSTAHDVLYGENGNDTLIGGPGIDELWGGAGNDRFLFTHTGATDTIGDFQTGMDKIDLSDIDANTAAAGNQAFSFIGSAAFSGTAGELRVYNAGSVGNVVAVDVNGDSIADLMINLGSVNAASTDFLL